MLFNPTWDTHGIIDYGGQRKLMLIDGPDGKEITRGGKAHPLRSYSVAELYFGRPLYAVTLFPAFSDLLLSIVRLPERQRGPTVYSGGGRRGGR